MTKGHYHAKDHCSEIYFGLVGEGYILLQTPDGEVSSQYIKPDYITYVPPFWAHRAVNTGAGNFSFLAVYPADAGYDYMTIEKNGFSLTVIDKAGEINFVPSTGYRKGY
jgi:glucose-6-phosphate isomerase